MVRTPAASPYPLVEVAGAAYQLGVQHGEQCRDRVRQFLEIVLAGACRQGRSPADVLLATRSFRPLFERHVPQLLEEVRGLADGAGIQPEEALLLQIRGEIAGVATGACTTFVISGDGAADGSILIGQNSDMGPEQEEVGIVLRVIPATGPRLLMWTFAGHLGYHGINSAGVAHFANALGGGPAWRLGLPHYPAKRRMLEQTTVAEALGVWDSYPVCSSGNYVLTGGCGTIEDVEVTPEGYACLGDGGEGFIVHTNHFLSPRFRTAQTDAASIPDSFRRYERMRALVGSAHGRLTVASLQRILSDHDGHPGGICRHPQPGADQTKTVASLIAEPAVGRLHISRGNPCSATYTTYTV